MRKTRDGDSQSARKLADDQEYVLPSGEMVSGNVIGSHSGWPATLVVFVHHRSKSDCPCVEVVPLPPLYLGTPPGVRVLATKPVSGKESVAPKAKSGLAGVKSRTIL